MRSFLILAASLGFAGCASMGGSPSATMATTRSASDVKTTMDKVEATAKARGFSIVSRIDHAAAAQRAGQSLRPTELLIFGNPQGGTPLMNCAQTSGIDLPIKMLAWQDAAGAVWLGYNEPSFLASRHGMGEQCATPLANMKKALDGIAAEAVKP